MAYPAQFLHCCFKKTGKNVSKLLLYLQVFPFTEQRPQSQWPLSHHSWGGTTDKKFLSSPILPQYSWKAVFYVTSHSPVCIKHGQCFTLCYANIRSQAIEKIGKSFTLTPLCRLDKLPKLTEETGHIV